MALDIATIQINISAIMINNQELLTILQNAAGNIQPMGADPVGSQLERVADLTTQNRTGRNICPLPFDEALTEYKAGRAAYEKIMANIVEARLLLKQIPPTDVP